MNTKLSYAKRLLAATTMAVLAGTAVSDESEIFTGKSNSVSSQRPNILFIMDTSGSMSTNVVTQIPYDVNTTYAGACRADRVYFRQGTNPASIPSCSDSSSFPLVAFKCNAALSAMAVGGFQSAGRAGQWRSSSGQFRWRSVSGNTGNSTWVECQADAGIHGDGLSSTRLWAADGGNGPWTANFAQRIGYNANGADRSYVFFSANYVNWYRGLLATSQTRLQIVQTVAKDTIDRLAVNDNVNLGLMRFSDNANLSCGDTNSAEGGMVLREINTVASNAAAMKADIDALNADGCTPLSETMLEAYRYLSGGLVRYGINSRRNPTAGNQLPSVLSSREPSPNENRYLSPLQTSCQRNFIVLLTDGRPTSDTSADTEIQGLIGRTCTGTGDGRCLEEIAQHMYTADMRPALPGLQNVTTYTIGFGDEVRGSDVLRNTANGAGGVFYEASDTASLSAVLSTIVRTILDTNTTFTAPVVSVNAFNRTRNLNELYVTVFRPAETFSWPGNLKKYRLDQTGTILDANGDPAVDITTGFFRRTAQSVWSTAIDGDEVGLGGAAGRLPLPDSRRMFSDLDTGAALTATTNEVTIANLGITEAMLGLAPAEVPGRDTLINWLRGADTSDENNDGSTTDSRLAMGDPMHGRPATVIYGGTVASPDIYDSVVYGVTNDGYLHALDTRNGDELWAFMPRQLMDRARDMYVNDAAPVRTYGLDGNIRVIKNDLNDNGIIEPLLGDKVMIYFGMRRGGNDYFGLDVTDRNSPTMMWRIGPSETGLRRLPFAGQSWSTPTPVRVNIAGATQNALQQVLVFGGGYDTAQDNGPYATDTVGRQIFMVDAVSGNLLWYTAHSSDTGADLRLPLMTHSIPGDIRVFDYTGDGLADRMYAGDMGGRVWRFDINNGQARANLVAGGVFASLGNAHLGTHPDTTNRRFYSAPDVAFLSDNGRTWLNIALGSGYRGHPLETVNQDRFYSLRDYRPFARLTQVQYGLTTPITESDVTLVDVSSDINPVIPSGASGWRMDLRRPSGSWIGEKSLAEARTVQSMIQFTTYEPSSTSTVTSTSCAPGIGINRLYTVSAFTGAPVVDRENPADPPDSTEDRDSELAQRGIAPEVVWLFPSPDDPVNCVGAECRPPPRCLVGLENCGIGINLAPVRTFWRQTGVN